MALPTNYKDDVLDVSVNERRKFNMINNADGSVSFEDVTEYTQLGTPFSSQDVNQTNRKVNDLENSFSQALTDLKATAIARAVGATGTTFASVIQKLAAIVNRGSLNKSMVPGESYNVAAGYYSGGTVSVAAETGTFNATTNGTHDMGATNNNRYVNVNVTPHLVGTYSAPTNIDVSAYPNGQFIAVPVSGGYHQTYHHDHVSGSEAGGWIKNQTDYVPPSTSRSGNILSITPAYLHDTTYYYVLDNFQYPTQVSGEGVEYLATQIYYIG